MASTTMITRCPNGNGCFNAHCNKGHPNTRKCGKIQPAPMCANDTKCDHIRCFFRHTVAKPTDCQLGEKCHNKDCVKIHPSPLRQPGPVWRSDEEHRKILNARHSGQYGRYVEDISDDELQALDDWHYAHLGEIRDSNGYVHKYNY